MHIIRVTPLAALPNTVPPVLDYFWPGPLPRGALVRATVGRRAVNALVLESLDVARAKMAVRKSSFGLKRLSAVISDRPQATAGQMELIRWLAAQYHAPLGLCAKSVLPAFIGKRGHLLDISDTPTARTVPERTDFILTQPETALENIGRLISSAAGTVLVVVPEVTLALRLAEHFKARRPLLVHGQLGVRAHAAAYRAVLDGTAPVIIGTRLALSLPYRELERVIVEDPLHEAYKSDMAPRSNAPDVARQLARIHGASLTYLSPAMSTVNRYLIDQKTFAFRDDKPDWPRLTTVDMVRERQDGNRSLLSRSAQEALMDAYDDRRPVLFFSPRRAYASVAACERCHKPVLCGVCAVPMRFHRTSEDMLVCYHCAAFTGVPKQCPACHAGALCPAGLAGSQKIVQAVNTFLDRHGLRTLAIPILDSDLVRDDAGERELLARFDAMERPLLVATQMIFSHRYERSFDMIVVVQADALSYNPDFRTQERLIYQLEKLADLSPKTMFLQSWETQGVLAHAPGRAWGPFYERELAERKALGWPPFTRVVKLTTYHRERAIADRSAKIAADRLRRAAAHLGMAKTATVLGPTPALVERAGGRWTQHIVLKTTLTAVRLAELLAHVPGGWTIDIDPRSIT